MKIRTAQPGSHKKEYIGIGTTQRHMKGMYWYMDYSGPYQGVHMHMDYSGPYKGDI